METNTAVQRPVEDTENYIDLLEIVRVIWRRIWIVAIGLIVGAGIAFSYTKFLVTPLYRATSTIYIFSKTTSITSLADLQIGSQLAQDFQIIATTRNLVESVIDELYLDTTYEQLVESISVDNPTQSHMLRISVTNPNPSQAANIANALSEQLREQIADIMNTDKPSVVQRAVPPVNKASPNTTRNTSLGGILGAVLVIAVIVIRHMLDDTIKSGDDIRKYLGMDTLAEFPFIKSQARNDSGSSGKKLFGRRKRSRK